MDEFDLIDRYFRPLAKDFGGAFDLRDDAAIVTPPAGMECVITADMLIEGVHFFGSESPAWIAKKALRVNLSDLAAKGAAPYCYLLTLGLSPSCDEAWVAGFAAGLSEDQEEYGIALAGGDTTRSNSLLNISITAIGLVPIGSIVKRSGARVGDALYVSGTIGDAALGLALARGEFAEMSTVHKILALDRYHAPQPRTKLAEMLRKNASAAMDISDGIFQDAGHLLRASDVGAEIALDAIPLSAAMGWVKKHHPNRWLELLGGGDDYEILCTAKEPFGSAFTRVGQITGTKTLLVKDGAGNIITPPKGYTH